MLLIDASVKDLASLPFVRLALLPLEGHNQDHLEALVDHYPHL